MMINYFLPVFILSVSVLTSCSSAPNNVFYFSQVAEAERKSRDIQLPDGSLQIFIDAFGNVYPKTGYPSTPNLIGNSATGAGSLFNQSVHQNSELCLNSENNPGSDAYLLCQTIATEKCDFESQSCSTTQDWKSAQKQLWHKEGQLIYEQAARLGKDEVLFLIHGFNNTYSESSGWYENVINEIHAQGFDPLMVELYWDGFNGTPLFTKSWGFAQSAGPLVGFKLRQLFHGMELAYNENDIELPKIRMFSHSSGAFVIGALLGNPYSALPNLYDEDRRGTDFSEFYEHRDGSGEQYPIPNFPEIRVGMIAAATSTDTFTGVGKQDPERESGLLSPNTTLIFSLNTKDWVLGKVFGLENLNAGGATGAGADVGLYCAFLANLNEHKEQVDAVYAFDFTRGGILNRHGVNAYFLSDKKEAFIKTMFAANDSDFYQC
ncbi:MAG: hypothetical protein JKY86_13500 [Gammaproteobacteria bacterium]|nr:hypothetical protein [Gammaproteobacteria bacterium]